MEALTSASIVEMRAVGRTEKAGASWRCQRRRLLRYSGILPGGTACRSISCPFCAGGVLRCEWASAAKKLMGADPDHCHHLTILIGIAGTAWDSLPLIEKARKAVRALARRVRRTGGFIEVYGLVEAMAVPAGVPPAGEEWRASLGELPRCGKGEVGELMLHAHVAVHMPNHTQDEILVLFRQHFDGHPDRVRATPFHGWRTVGQNAAGIVNYAAKALRPLNPASEKRPPLAAEVAVRMLYCLPRGLAALRIEVEPKPDADVGEALPPPQRIEAERGVHANAPCRQTKRTRAGRSRQSAVAADAVPGTDAVAVPAASAATASGREAEDGILPAPAEVPPRCKRRTVGGMQPSHQRTAKAADWFDRMYVVGDGGVAMLRPEFLPDPADAVVTLTTPPAPVPAEVDAPTRRTRAPVRGDAHVTRAPVSGEIPVPKESEAVRTHRERVQANIRRMIAEAQRHSERMEALMRQRFAKAVKGGVSQAPPRWEPATWTWPPRARLPVEGGPHVAEARGPGPRGAGSGRR